MMIAETSGPTPFFARSASMSFAASPASMAREVSALAMKGASAVSRCPLRLGNMRLHGGIGEDSRCLVGDVGPHVGTAAPQGDEGGDGHGECATGPYATRAVRGMPSCCLFPAHAPSVNRRDEAIAATRRSCRAWPAPSGPVHQESYRQAIPRATGRARRWQARPA